IDPCRYFYEIARDAGIDSRTIEFTEDAIPIPLHKFCSYRPMLPGIADVCQDRCKRNDLGLVGQIEETIDVEHVQKLGCGQKTAFCLRLVLFVSRERQVQKSLPIAGNLRKISSLSSQAFRHAPNVPRVEQRDDM